MATRIKVYVFEGNTGKSGIKVTTNHMKGNVETDSSGAASLIVEESKVKIFVDGTKVYDGFTSSCPNPLECDYV